MKTKKYALIENYPYVKEIYGEIISVKDLAYICRTCEKSILRYIIDKTIFSTFSSNTHIIHVESLINKKYIPPQIPDLDESLRHLELYCGVNRVNKTINLPWCVIKQLKIHKIGSNYYYSLEELNKKLKNYYKILKTSTKIQ
ncbi:hypothetical protein NON08_06170 [Cetobacterium somerae]|uniref:hypothetical protein n=1 Tax=Cetobacterium sp. NK01 TaxID=2993530 RepID=UPI00211641D9|nr:hypothetical protein [Cetobacterium sp. NK01]MCQ8212109.1 hypothetical protein [Cetobacterium sp. NK01]